jgi:hypothetical protein
MYLYIAMKKNIPQELADFIGDEKIVFSVRSKRKKPLTRQVRFFAGSLFLLLISGAIATAFVFSASLALPEQSMGLHVLAFLFASIVVFFPLMVFVRAIFSFFRSGGYFVGTPNRLIHYRHNRKIKSRGWGAFAPNVMLHNLNQHGVGNVILELKKRIKTKDKKGNNTFYKHRVYMCSVENVLHIKSTCEQRIDAHS